MFPLADKWSAGGLSFSPLQRIGITPVEPDAIPLPLLARRLMPALGDTHFALAAGGADPDALQWAAKLNALPGQFDFRRALANAVDCDGSDSLGFAEFI